MFKKYRWLKYRLWAWWHGGLPSWVAFHLPAKVVYWCALRVGVHATTGWYSNQVVTELDFETALTRWENDHHKEHR